MTLIWTTSTPTDFYIYTRRGYQLHNTISTDFKTHEGGTFVVYLDYRRILVKEEKKDQVRKRRQSDWENSHLKEKVSCFFVVIFRCDLV